jgi:uncharacterized protein YmfQ (DUF2313 family)
MGLTVSLTTEGYKHVVKGLFPSGSAWKLEPGKNITALAEGFAPEMSRYDSSLSGFLTEVNPGTSIDLLPEWENLLGCPWNGSDPVSVRQANVLARLTAAGDQSVEYFIGLAKNLGFDLTITEFTQSVAGSYAGCPCVNQYWKFTALFNLPVTPGNAGNKGILQEIVGENQPAHIFIIFNWQ